MSERPSPTPSEALLAEHPWVARLARRLVSDAALADDVAQEACLRALEHPPRASAAARAWLGGIARNVVRQWRREDGRRAGREALVARPEAGESAVDALARISLQQEVVNAVLALEEPYRSTVVLRFYEGLPPRTIARRVGLPVATVKTRLARGLAQLRARLDREHGEDGRSWALALAPLVANARPPAPLVLGALGALGAAGAVLVLFTWLRPEAREVGAPSVASASVAQDELSTPRPSSREPLAAPAEELSSAEDSAPLASTFAGANVSGRVIDPNGEPVAGVELALRACSGGGGDFDDQDFGGCLWTEDAPLAVEPLALSAGDGTFELVLPPEYYGRLVSSDPRFETVLAPFASADEGRTWTVLVAPAVTLSGTVQDGEGNALSGVELDYAVPASRLASGEADLYNTIAVGWKASSAADGRFTLRVPAVPGGKLRARLEPYETLRLSSESWSSSELELVLALPAGAWLTGRVVEADGAPLADATVALGVLGTKTDSLGEFRLSLSGHEQEDTLVAVAPGRRALRLQGSPGAGGVVAWPSAPLLRLVEPDLALAGRLVDESGTPLAGASLWLLDGEVIGLRKVPFALESFAAGEGRTRHGTKSAADGTFRLAGLEARDYHLLVVEGGSALHYEVGPFAAGSEALELVRPAGATWPLVRGVVRDDTGTPLAGEEVVVLVDLPPVGFGDSYLGLHALGSRATTDERGNFELASVPRSGARLDVFDARFLDLEFPLEEVVDPLALALVLVPWTDLQIDARAGFPEADACGALDAAGNVVPVQFDSAGALFTHYRVELHDARSARVRVGAQARTLVLWHGEEELARLPLELARDRLNVLAL